MKGSIKEAARRTVDPVAGLLHSLGVAPNHITVAGLALSALAAVALGAGRFGLTVALLLLGSVCDMLDGAVARNFDRASDFGAFFDSTVDRLAELVVFIGAAVYFHRQDPSTVYLVLSLLAAGGSFLVSYARARAEGLGLECSVGLMERPERLVLLLVALLFGGPGLKVALWVLTPLVFYTVWQRVDHVRRISVPR